MKNWRLIIVVLTVAAIIFIGSFFGLTKTLKDVFWRSANPVGSVMRVSFGRMPGFLRNFFEIGNVIKQNHDLVSENLDLQSQLAKLNEVSYENEILKKELNFAQSHEQTSKLMPAAIIGRASGYLKSVTVDKGSQDGLTKGQAVISQGFLVGVVGDVRSNNSDITLITDYNSLVPATLQSSRGTGLLRGGLAGLIVEDIPLNISINKNEVVVTSGLGGQIPSGLAIGKVQDTLSRAGEIFQKVSIESPIDFSRLEVLFVVKK